MINPDRIYLQVDPDGVSACDWIDGVTWCQDRINDTDVEYIRADLVSVHQQGVEGEKTERCDYCNAYHEQKMYCRNCGKT